MRGLRGLLGEPFSLFLLFVVFLFAEVTCSSNRIGCFVDSAWDFVSCGQLNFLCLLLLKSL